MAAAIAINGTTADRAAMAADADRAAMAADAAHAVAEAGAVVTAWRTAAAGPNSLNLAYSLGFENFAALQTFGDGAQTAGPLRRLAQTGALEFVSAGISVRIGL